MHLLSFVCAAVFQAVIVHDITVPAVTDLATHLPLMISLFVLLVTMLLTLVASQCQRCVCSCCCCVSSFLYLQLLQVLEFRVQAAQQAQSR